MKTISSGQGHGEVEGQGTHSGSLHPTPTACLSLRHTWGTGLRLPVLKLDSISGDQHLERKKVRNRECLFSRIRKEAEKPGGFPARLLSTRKEEGARGEM